MSIFQGFDGAEDHFQFLSNFCHKIFHHRLTIRHLPNYKIVNQKFLTDILKIVLFRQILRL